jgi:hypothetical protein
MNFISFVTKEIKVNKMGVDKAKNISHDILYIHINLTSIISKLLKKIKK